VPFGLRSPFIRGEICFFEEYRTRHAAAGLVSRCECLSERLALLCQLFSAFFGLNQHVLRVAQVLFPTLPRFPVAASVIKLKVMQVFQKFGSGTVWIFP
jgi:hypothetical protein